MDEFKRLAEQHNLDPKIIEYLKKEDLNDLESLRNFDIDKLDISPQHLQELISALQGNSLESWAEFHKIKQDSMDKLKDGNLVSPDQLKTVNEEQLKELGISLGQRQAFKKAKRYIDFIKNMENLSLNTTCKDVMLFFKQNGPPSDTDEEVRVVLIGKTGVGKSATANTLLGRSYFRSALSAISTTQKCKRGETFTCGKRLILVDTPGLFDTGKDNETVSNEIIKCIGISSPGPHAIVLVCNAGRFTQEEQDTVQYFVDKFGRAVLNYMIVLFTRKDDLKTNDQTVDQFIEQLPGIAADILRDCGNRYIAFNNRAGYAESEAQVQKFFQIVQSMVNKNGGSYYTNELYEEAEEIIKQRMSEERQKLEKEKENEMMEIQKIYDYDMAEQISQSKTLQQRLEEKEKEFLEKMKEENLRKEQRNAIEYGFFTWLKSGGLAIKKAFEDFFNKNAGEKKDL